MLLHLSYGMLMLFCIIICRLLLKANLEFVQVKLEGKNCELIFFLSPKSIYVHIISPGLIFLNPKIVNKLVKENVLSKTGSDSYIINRQKVHFILLLLQINCWFFLILAHILIFIVTKSARS